MKNLLLAVVFLLPSLAHAKTSPPLVTQVSKLRYEVSQSAVDRDLKDPAEQLTTFVALPDFGTGFFSGVKVSGFSKKCLLPKFGIKSGDVVEMVNGQTISGPSDIYEIGEKLSKAKPGHKVRVNVRRGSEDLILTYLLVE